MLGTDRHQTHTTERQSNTHHRRDRRHRGEAGNSNTGLLFVYAAKRKSFLSMKAAPMQSTSSASAHPLASSASPLSPSASVQPSLTLTVELEVRGGEGPCMSDQLTRQCQKQCSTWNSHNISYMRDSKRPHSPNSRPRQ